MVAAAPKPNKVSATTANVNTTAAAKAPTHQESNHPFLPRPRLPFCCCCCLLIYLPIHLRLPSSRRKGTRKSTFAVRRAGLNPTYLIDKVGPRELYLVSCTPPPIHNRYENRKQPRLGIFSRWVISPFIAKKRDKRREGRREKSHIALQLSRCATWALQATAAKRGGL